MKHRQAWLGIVVLGGMVGLIGCAVIPPTQEMSDARQAIEAAKEAQAQHYFPNNLYCAEQHLLLAEQELISGHYTEARFNALAAKRAAIDARQVAGAVTKAKDSIEAAAQAGQILGGAETLLLEARQSAQQGNVKAALLLAEEARLQGEYALNQANLRRAKQRVQNLQARAATLSPAQLQGLDAVLNALRSRLGQEANLLLDALENTSP